MDAMVTGRMAAEKKSEGNAVLARFELNPSQAIGLMYDRLIKEKDASFLLAGNKASPLDWGEAAAFVDGLSIKRESRYHEMSKGDVKLSRCRSREGR